jgi:glycosyltransferase involved in cell wall biosynthesis
MSRAWNVCLTHDPALAGLYRAVNDFSRALAAPVLSFDDGRRDRRALAATDGASRVDCGSGFLSRHCHRLSATARRQAEALVADADLLVVHSMFRAHAPWAADWARRLRRRYWAVPHGCLDPWGLAQRAMAKRAWLAVHGGRYFGGAERIVCATRRELEKARPWLRHTERAVVIPWPVDLPSLADCEPGRARFRSHLGLPSDAPVLLCVGRLHSMKRPLETVQSFCRAAGNHCHLAVVGMDGDLTATAMRAAVPPMASGRVHVVGGLAGRDLADAYRASDGFISLSHRENFGFALADAIAYGLPVIVTPGHDLAHELPRRPDGQLACGWLLPDDSPTAADEAVRAWSAAASVSPSLTGPHVRGHLGRDWAAEHLSFERFQAAIQRLDQTGCMASKPC